MKKYLSILTVLLVISPSIALASWWNPFSWSIWNIFNRENNVAQVINSAVHPTKSNQEIASSTTNETILCNGQYWNKCPDGQLLVCPIDGKTDAYCSVPKTPTTKTSITATPTVKTVAP